MESRVGDETKLCHKSTMASVRFILNVALVFITIIILIWMLSERDKVRSCTEMQRLQLLPTPEPKVITIIREKGNNNSRSGEWDYNWDRKAISDHDDGRDVATRTLILVRHGQYNLQTGKLTQLGRRQANLTGIRLKAMNLNYKEIIYSTLERAAQTAELIQAQLAHLPANPDDYIREGGPVPPKPTISYWSLPDRDYYVDGPRLEAAFRKYFYRADKHQTEKSHQILVGHGNIFRFFVLRALQLPKEAWMRVFIAHASITMLHINGDGTVNMDKFGDAGHFPPDMVTY